MGLYETYLATKAQETPEVSSEEEKVASEQMEILAKYAEAADEALKEEYGNDYTLDDVEKLADLFIQRDLQLEEEQEKIASIQDEAKIFAHSFVEELQKISEESEE